MLLGNRERHVGSGNPKVNRVENPRKTVTLNLPPQNEAYCRLHLVVVVLRFQVVLKSLENLLLLLCRKGVTQNFEILGVRKFIRAQIFLATTAYPLAFGQQEQTTRENKKRKAQQKGLEDAKKTLYYIPYVHAGV